MIRRFSAALVALALTGILASGCSSVSTTRNAADTNGRHLTVAQYQLLLQGVAKSSDTFQIPPVDATGMPGTTARGILGQWVSNVIMSDALVAKGVPVSAADRKAAEDKILSGNAATVWAGLSDELKSFVLDSQTLQPAFAAAFGADAQATLITAAQSAKVSIDSRYGMWDSATGQVVATR